MRTIQLKVNPRTGKPVCFGPGPRLSARYRLRSISYVLNRTPSPAFYRRLEDRWNDIFRPKTQDL